MSDFHKPTFTFPDNAYHATQVRLYGIPGFSDIGHPARPTTFTIDNTDVTISQSGRYDIGEEESNQVEAKLRAVDPSHVDAWPPFSPFAFPVKFTYFMPMQIKAMGVVYISASFDFEDADDRPLSIGIIYGYAYEGHCYDLPKPKIMLLPALPRSIPADDCGYKEKEAEGYRLWIVDKLDQCVEIEVNQGFVEQLVLEANLPGRRSPSTYRATMALNHRGGRLTE